MIVVVVLWCGRLDLELALLLDNLDLRLTSVEWDRRLACELTSSELHLRRSLVNRLELWL